MNSQQITSTYVGQSQWYSICLVERIPVKSSLNITAWRTHLSIYFDKQLVDLLQFGLPLDFDRILKFICTFVNYASAKQYQSHTDEYLKEGLIHGATLGPFDNPHFHI